jgi:tetratricopeptide (TPR) repeat protein
VPIKQETQIADANIVKWRTRAGPLDSKQRAGFMSQVSPDGRYVLTTINDPRLSHSASGSGSTDDGLYEVNFTDYRFLTAFYPTRGILAWSSTETGVLTPLSGADDDLYVQAGGVWSPDGKSIVFLRADARRANPTGQGRAESANDANETQIRYDLYRIPFNDGKGGTAERIEGASQNGMSNSFPKVSPDGRWIVYVEARNGQLLRPDSKLFIVPFEGGKARPLNSNTSLMNSWHSFSPNGRWLVFSSKARSPYTQMYLTHMDENGNDSPAILIDNSTASNRAVNLPEFVNLPQDGLIKMDAPVADFFKEFDTAVDLGRNGNMDDAIAQFRKALQLSSGDANALFRMGQLLEREGDAQEAFEQFDAALKTDANHSRNGAVYADLGRALARMGKLDEALESYSKALAATPDDPQANAGLGAALLEKGRLDESIERCRKALDIDEDNAAAHNTLGVALARNGNLADASLHLQRAVELEPNSFEAQFDLGRVLAAQSNFSEALVHFQKAVEVSGGKEAQSLLFLSLMYSETDQISKAVETAQRALAIAVQKGDRKTAESLRQRIAAWQAGGGFGNP